MIGGNAVGCETADFLASADGPSPESAAFLLVHGAEDPQRLRGLLRRSLRQVTVVEMVERMAVNVGPSTRWVLMKDLQMKGVELRTGTKLVAITDTDVVVETAAGRESIPADTVVMAVGTRSVNDLARRIERDGTPVVTLGDAASPRNMIDAIREGFEAALAV